MRGRWAYAATVMFGGVHALSSFYWGLGGRRLLDTVGQGAVELRAQAPWWIFLMLLVIGAAKVVGIWIPIANARGRLRRMGAWRALSWAGALGLMAYGGVYMAVAHLALSGHFGQVEDQRGLWGHAYIWDPLFLAWGAALAVALFLDRPARGRSMEPHSDPPPDATHPG